MSADEQTIVNRHATGSMSRSQAIFLPDLALQQEFASSAESAKTAFIPEAGKTERLIPSFYVKALALFVAISTVFATLLGLDLFFNIHTIHPFLAIVGLLGGLGTILPVVMDIRMHRR